MWYVPITDDASQCFNVIIRNGNKDKAINADLKVDISDRETNPAVTYMPGKKLALTRVVSKPSHKMGHQANSVSTLLAQYYLMTKLWFGMPPPMLILSS
ncbi:hypothetical protein QW180_20430 [Vibrio sinaloensis]|nr:hypothetical protein [Vibrio sinaloensis]